MYDFITIDQNDIICFCSFKLEGELEKLALLFIPLYFLKYV